MFRISALRSNELVTVQCLADFLVIIFIVNLLMTALYAIKPICMMVPYKKINPSPLPFQINEDVKVEYEALQMTVACNEIM